MNPLPKQSASQEHLLREQEIDRAIRHALALMNAGEHELAKEILSEIDAPRREAQRLLAA